MAKTSQAGARTARDAAAEPQRIRGSTSGARPELDAATGERDEIYGVVSVLYHALQGAQTYAQYSADARKAGDSELEKFFEACRSEEQQRAARAKALLVVRIDEDASSEDEDEDDDDDDDASSDDDEE